VKAFSSKYKPSDHLRFTATLFPSSMAAMKYKPDLLLGRENGNSGSEDERSIKVKEEPRDTDTDVETREKQGKSKKRASPSTTTRPSAPKKRKPSPPIASPPITRTRTRKPSPSKVKAEPEAIIIPRSNITSNIAVQPPTTVGMTLLPQPPALLPYLDLLRPYLAFQLSRSGLSCEAYESAQASMTEVIDVVDRLKKCSDSIGEGEGKEVGKKAFVNKKDGNGIVLVNKGKEEESIVARKLRRLEDAVGVDSVRTLSIPFPTITLPSTALTKTLQETHDDTNSSASDSSTGSDTEVASDEDEQDALERRVDSIFSASTGYESRSSSTDSAESESVSHPSLYPNFLLRSVSLMSMNANWP
jgi:hypothetical protein